MIKTKTEIKERCIKALENLRNSFWELNTLWSNSDTEEILHSCVENYPSWKSFDECTTEVNDFVDETVKLIRELK